MPGRLKVCGITGAAFAVEAARRGVDYLGFVFAHGSPRCVAIRDACEIADCVRTVISHPRHPRFVGVFTTHNAAEILEIAKYIHLDVVQLHDRDYGADEISALQSEGLEVWALHNRESNAEQIADAVLLDGCDGDRCGGTGRRADWSLVPLLKAAGRRVVLAGGISADNVAAAAATGADVIDANSSLETSPGVKSVERLDGLLAALRPPLPPADQFLV